MTNSDPRCFSCVVDPDTGACLSCDDPYNEDGPCDCHADPEGTTSETC